MRWLCMGSWEQDRKLGSAERWAPRVLGGCARAKALVGCNYGTSFGAWVVTVHPSSGPSLAGRWWARGRGGVWKDALLEP